MIDYGPKIKDLKGHKLYVRDRKSEIKDVDYRREPKFIRRRLEEVAVINAENGRGE
uniref:Uncharacterized protein n=1 Tax=Onchocerca volvulus TaxID=6282 RepID=A0A8R1U140_ONCVO